MWRGSRAVVDPLVARDLLGWGGRVVRLCRSEFRPLAGLAVVPAAVTVGYLLALNWVRQGPEQLRSRLAEMAAANGGRCRQTPRSTWCWAGCYRW